MKNGTKFQDNSKEVNIDLSPFDPTMYLIIKMGIAHTPHIILGEVTRQK